MRSILVRAELVCLVTFLLLSQAGGAQDVSIANATPVGPADCTIEPRPTDELRALTVAGLARITARLPSTPVLTPLASPGPESEASPEVPTDAAPFKEVQEIVRQIAACTNAGDIGALVSLYDDEGAAAYLAVGFESFEQVIPGSDATVNPALIDLYLGSLQLSAPLPEEVRISAYRVDSVTVQDDGLIYVVASFARGENAPTPFAFYLRNDDGQYRIVFDAPENVQSNGAPIATPQP